MCTTGFVHVEAMPSVGCGIRDVRGADIMLDNGPVWNTGREPNGMVLLEGQGSQLYNILKC